jgi:hypothetical protein
LEICAGWGAQSIMAENIVERNKIQKRVVVQFARKSSYKELVSGYRFSDIAASKKLNGL